MLLAIASIAWLVAAPSATIASGDDPPAAVPSSATDQPEAPASDEAEGEAEPAPPTAAAPPAPSAPSEPQTPPATADGTTSVMVAPPPEPTPPAAVRSEPPTRPTAADALPAADAVPAVPAGTPRVFAGSPGVEQRPTAAVTVEEPSGAAPALLVELLEPVGGTTASAAYARPLTLLEALQRSGDPSRRLWIVQAYWKTAIAFAAVKSCSDAGQRVDLVAPGGDPHDRAVLDVAVASARSDLAEAIAVLGTTQQELIDLARLPQGEPPPWPVDRPLATPYQTHFDTIFAQRIATGRVRAIARTLPARHESLEARAMAVRAATDVVAMAESDHAKGRRPIEAVVAAHAALVAQERDFLRIARAYNTDIAEYAMSVADLSVPDEAFVAMLIGPPRAPRMILPTGFGGTPTIPGAAPTASPLGTLP